MKLASLKEGGRDGTLVVVDRGLERAVKATEVAPSLQAAIDDWENAAPRLNTIAEELEAGKRSDAFALEPAKLAAPFPRGYQFLDGSAYLPHVQRVRRARGAEMPPEFWHDPLMYQAVTDGYMGPRDSIVAASEEHGIDFEAEVGVVTDDVPMGVDAQSARGHIQLVLILNDVSLRNLIPGELKKGFGFLQGKPRSALSPVAVTPDELGEAWDGAKLHGPLVTHLNGELFGQPDCGVDMNFDFGELIAHGAKTRPLAAGTIVGSGTIANEDETKGSSCLAERRVLEKIKEGEPKTPFMRFGDRVHIEMLDAQGRSIFGAIDQTVEQYSQ